MSYRCVENVVLGFSTNLAAERVEVFAKTLRNVYSNQECDLVIYTNNVDNELRRIATEYSVTFLYTPSVYSSRLNKISKFFARAIIYCTKWLASSTYKSSSLKNVFYELYPMLLKLWHHPHFVRWLSYKEFLQTHRTYKRILLSDVKDVAFQSRFFESLDDADLHIFEQDVNYGDEDIQNRWDTDWYREAYGEKELKKLVNKPAFCIGTVMGSFEGIEAFVELIGRDILKKPFGRIEQTILNHLYYTNGFKTISLKIHENAVGPVLTMNKDSLSRFKVTSEGIVDLKGKLIPVVHMYDRHQQPKEYFTKILGYEMKQPPLLKS